MVTGGSLRNGVKNEPWSLIMSKTIKQQWWEYHKKNPHVWDLFVTFTFQIINRADNLAFERAQDAQLPVHLALYLRIRLVRRHQNLCKLSKKSFGLHSFFLTLAYFGLPALKIKEPIELPIDIVEDTPISSKTSLKLGEKNDMTR